jgi:hypothetical protein
LRLISGRAPNDFIDAVDTTYSQYATKEVIEIKPFCEAWLSTSGVNIITPVVVTNAMAKPFRNSKSIRLARREARTGSTD